MNRLLFAAARLARIQRRYYLQTASDIYRPWEDTLEISINVGSDYDYRIHPEDVDLQYGFLSRHLRAAAEECVFLGTTMSLAYPPNPYVQQQMLYQDYEDFMKNAGVYQELVGCVCPPDLHRSLFLLLLAEAYMDEGM